MDVGQNVHLGDQQGWCRCAGLAVWRRYPATGTGPWRSPSTFPAGSLNHAPRAGPNWAIKLTVFGVSYSSKVTPRREIAHDGLDVVDLEVQHGLTTGRRLPAPDREL